MLLHEIHQIEEGKITKTLGAIGATAAFVMTQPLMHNHDVINKKQQHQAEFDKIHQRVQDIDSEIQVLHRRGGNEKTIDRLLAKKEILASKMNKEISNKNGLRTVSPGRWWGVTD